MNQKKKLLREETFKLFEKAENTQQIIRSFIPDIMLCKKEVESLRDGGYFKEKWDEWFEALNLCQQGIHRKRPFVLKKGILTLEKTFYELFDREYSAEELARIEESKKQISADERTLEILGRIEKPTLEEEAMETELAESLAQRSGRIYKKKYLNMDINLFKILNGKIQDLKKDTLRLTELFIDTYKAT